MAHPVYYSPDFVRATDHFDTTRKAGWLADSLSRSPIPGVTLTSPPPLDLKDALRFHSRDYLKALATGSPLELASSSRIAWDPDTLARALSTCGGLLAAAETALRTRVAGCLASGFHHARRDQGQGFCTLNGLAITANLIAERSRAPVLILDLDSHCGGGTHGLIAHNPLVWQIDLSADSYDSYPGSKRGVLQLVRDPKDYLRLLWQHLKHAEDEWPPFSLCIYNAGMDVHEKCQYGGLKGIDELIIALREEMVFQWCGARGIPIAYTLAGGYTGRTLSRSRLIHLHRMTIGSANTLSA